MNCLFAYSTFLFLVFSGIIVEAQVRPYAPEIFPANISAAVCGFGNDGKTIYFVQEDTIQEKLSLFEADWNGTKWVNPRLLSFSGKHNDYGGRLTPDGRTFYFASDRPGASDNKDDLWNIWQVTRSTSGWNDPIALRQISSQGDECCPVPINNNVILFSGISGKLEWQIIQSEKNSVVQSLNIASAWQWPSYFDVRTNTLFFNSMKRSDSKGMDDIYSAKFINDVWTDIRNLGDVINTTQYEDGAILTPDGKVLIFCRHETGMTPSRVLCVDVQNIPALTSP